MIEWFAEYTCRPLLALNAIDTGTELRAAESKLKTRISLAEQWGALLLLDNAERYLSRNITDTASMNLMSGTSFLRH